MIGSPAKHHDLQKLNAKLVEANRALIDSEECAKTLVLELQIENRQLEGFIHSISHDLRGPLRAIQAASQMVLEDCSALLDAASIQMLERQVVNAKKIGAIVEGLLRLSRGCKSEMKMAVFNLSVLAEDVATEIKAEVSEPKLRFNIEPGTLAYGDPVLLRMVLLNLMDNAAKFSPEGGEIRFQARVCGDQLVCSVADNGIGFDAAHSELMFEPFHRLETEQEFPGSGIGLANVKRIVERHGGRVWVSSEPGKGATFFFSLGAAPALIGAA